LKTHHNQAPRTTPPPAATTRNHLKQLNKKFYFKFRREKKFFSKNFSGRPTAPLCRMPTSKSALNP